MSGIERKVARRNHLKDPIIKKRERNGRFIIIQALGKFHEYRLHATKGWRVKKVQFIKNPNIILFRDHPLPEVK